MAGISVKWLLLALSSHLIFTFAFSTKNPSSRKTYIIQMDESAMPAPYSDHLKWYSSIVKSAVSELATGGDSDEGRVIYSYQTAFHGVAALLSEEEAEKLQETQGVMAIFPDTVYQLHTTRSPTFLGLDRASISVWAEKKPEPDVVVGVLDTGIWPESQSFNDTGMGAVPAHWKGACETGRAFTKQHCNRKIVGARIFYRGYESANGQINEQEEYKSPRDQDGHGTHTAATVAGSPVRGANLLGYAYGTARGMAPKARIAIYKVCWAGGCFSSDILSAVDQAVADGVGVLSISLGGGVSPYFRDSLSVAAFGATEMGVFISCSAGNAGPDPTSLANVSPWITTVGASTIDRDFPATVKLGNGRILNGVSLYRGRRNLSTGKQYPVVYAGGNSSFLTPSSLCLEGSLDPHAVAGKIVICDRGVSPRVDKGQVVKKAGGLGMILTNTEANGEELVADCHLLPGVSIGEKAGRVIKLYASSPYATATLKFLGTKVGIRPSPVVAAFSSRGPNPITLEILKPDMVAPGVNILAAWSGLAGPSSMPTDRRRVKFNILSGTSMSCPHVSGIAALIKTKHPDWSPAAIKSALMTTAYVHDNTHKPILDTSRNAPSTPFDHGAGHIDPLKALNPGLIYDAGAQDYFDFLCTQGLSPMELQAFSKKRSCRNLANPADLNYPSISAVFPAKTSISALTLHRTVTNVGHAFSKYRVSVSRFKGASVKVQPETLIFTRKHQKLTFNITFITKSRQPSPEFGRLVWKDESHIVKSPLVITWLLPL
ncbi:subtilisin-like protease SBT1.3 [Malania oleifera]|uniref:subtilisin-like protease SBT1.3 n=1 Tax=Malania oleifera TaxID=397392 RepID=UPI0025ADBBF3|nr:subtilisin-like protease SBT1.3 [Malania oleifera]